MPVGYARPLPVWGVMRGLAWVAAMSALFAAPVHAQDEDSEKKQRAAVLTREATSHFRLNEFGDALKDYTEAYRAFPAPSLLYNIAQCHRQLNHKQDAIRFFKSYLNDVPNADNREEVLRFIQTLDLALKEENSAKAMPPQGPMTGSPHSPGPAPRIPLGKLHVTSTPDGAKIRFDDGQKVRVGMSPIEFGDLAPGTHRVFATKQGYETTVRNVDVVLGKTVVVDFRLSALESRPAADEPSPGTQTRPPLHKKWWVWTAAGATIMVAVGIVLGISLTPGASAPSASTSSGTFKF